MIEFWSELKDWSIDATVLNASRSSHESISSRIIYFGPISFIWRISIFLFSHPLNPTFRSRSINFSSIWSSCRYGFKYLRNINGESSVKSSLSFFEAILNIVLKYSESFTPCISGIFWNERNIHARDLSSGSISRRSSLSMEIFPQVTSYFGCPIRTLESVDFPLPFFPRRQ